MSEKDQILTGYILRIIPYKDSDAIITLLSTDSGLVTFKVRSYFKATSKLAPTCQLYTHGEYHLIQSKQNEHYLLKSAVVLTSLPALYTDIQVSLILAFVAESILRIEDYSAKEAFNLFNDIFQQLQKEVKFLTTILVVLKTNLEYLGLMLDAHGCVSCGTKKGLVSVHYGQGGFLCQRCASAINANAKSDLYLKTFRYIMLASIQKIEHFEVNDIIGKHILLDFIDFLENNGGINFKSLKLITNILNVNL